jgi:hypothetical protein
MGDNLPAVDLGVGRYAVQVAVSQVHACAILDNDGIKCWGCRGGGGLGTEDTSNRGALPDQMGDDLPEISLGTGLTAVSVSLSFPSGGTMCVELNTGDLKCFGDNLFGQLRQNS